MKTLWIYDHYAGVKPQCSNKLEQVDLFSLSGDGEVTQNQRRFIEQEMKVTTSLIDAARLIHDASLYVKENIADWSARIGRSRIYNRTLRTWLFQKSLNTSTWWFGIISGKNTFQSDAFLNIAQVHSIQDLIADSTYNGLIIQVRNKKLRDAIFKVARLSQLQAIGIEKRATTDSRDRLKQLLNYWVVAEACARGLYQLFLFCRIHLQLKKKFPSIERRMDGVHRSMFISPLPAINHKRLQSGQYVNNYFYALQDKFTQKNEGVNWLFHYVGLPGEGLDNEEKLVQKLLALGEKCFFIHEFINPKLIGKVILIWCRQLLLSLIFYYHLLPTLCAKPAGNVCIPILKHLWFESLCGISAVEGILYGMAFQEFSRILPMQDRTIYCAEMRGWEKAMVAAFQKQWPNTQTIGFQHAAISSTYYHFFYDPDELKDSIGGEQLPIPSVFALTGRKIKRLLACCRYPNTVEVEAARFLSINNVLSKPVDLENKRTALVVAGSISRMENRTLISLVHQAFPSGKGELEIWFKPHPHCLFDTIFDDLGIDPLACGYRVTTEDIAKVLESAKAVIVPTSTVSIEALAYGCEVFIPVVPDGLLMNPLADFPDFYHPVSSPDELKSELDAIIAQPPGVDMEQRRKFIKDYWFTDPGLPRWVGVLWN